MKYGNDVVLFVVVLAFVGFCVIYKRGMLDGSYVRSDLNGKEYFVQNYPNRDEAAYMLSVIDERLKILREHFLKHPNSYPQFKPYIDRFCNRSSDLFMYENSLDNDETAYTIGKGEETVICLRSKKSLGKLHDINLVMYVALHEVSHIACPDQDHTPLFSAILRFFVDVSASIGIYQKVDYQIDPHEYCGMIVRDKYLV